jgi:predicted phosphodiesterase
MVRILHISDPHSDSETMVRLNNLTTFQSEWDVVALTGDCASTTKKQVPPEWDRWPQKLKLVVPGNHDHPNTFDCLPTWLHQPPWVCRLNDLMFIGLDSPSLGYIKNRLSAVDWEGTRGVVLLLHERPRMAETAFGDVLRGLVDSRELLVLHGHEHPASFRGVERDYSGSLGGKPYFRSNVCSSVSSRRGLGQLISWANCSFSCLEVQGPKAPVL